MNETIPTATERIGERIRELRTFAGADQAGAAELLTALGSPAQPSTVTRIETGAQPPTVEQVLLFAMFASAGGLRNLLVPPFRIGDLVVRTDADLDTLFGGYPDQDGEPLPVKHIVRQYARRSNDLWDAQRDRGIARTLRVQPEKVAATARRLYGCSAENEVRARLAARLDELDEPPAGETPAYRAYRSHAVRAVTKEIGEALR